MNATVPAAREPVLTPSPNPARPPALPTEADRESALIWTMAGRSVDEITADTAETIARARGLALAMAELRDAGVTQDVAAAMIRANGGQAAGALQEPWQTSGYCSACYPSHPDPRCGCTCHLPASTVTVPGEMAAAA